jgi:hypothetical protein
MAVGVAPVRARGEVRGGFSGRTMMHPVVRAAGGALPAALTPVYPTVAGLPQPYLRAPWQAALARADLSETLPAAISDRNRPARRRGTCAFAHLFAPPDAGCVARRAGRPQPPGLAAPEGRGAAGPATLAAAGRANATACAPRAARPAPGGLHEQPAGRAAVWTDRPPSAAWARKSRRPGPRRAHAPPAAGRCGLRQDRGGGAGRCHRHRRRLAVRADGAHRDPGRAALCQADRLAGAAAGIRGRAWPG